jgi:hypothetical protein
MFTNQEVANTAAAAETPQPVPTLTAEGVVEGLRSMRAQIAEVTPLTNAQRATLRSHTRTTNPILQASINVIGALDIVSLAVGQPADEVRQMIDDANRWTAAEDEFRTMLNGIVGANLIRRQRIALIASQAFSIGAQLARVPAHAVLVPHVEEIRRLKSLKRRKKAAQAPGTPPSPAPQAPVTPAAPKA